MNRGIPHEREVAVADLDRRSHHRLRQMARRALCVKVAGSWGIVVRNGANRNVYIGVDDGR